MAVNPNRSNLDFNQIFQRVMDEPNDRLRVDAAVSFDAGTMDVVISQTDDSIRLGDGTNLVTATTVGSDVGLDVNVIGGVVSGTFTSSGLSNAIKNTVMTVTDVAAKVPTTPLTDRNSMSIRIMGTADVYFGSSIVTSTNGYPKKQFEEISIDIKDNAAVELWAVCASGQSCEIRILEVS